MIDTSRMKEIKILDKRFKSDWSEEMYQERITAFPELSYGAFIKKKLIGFVIGKYYDDDGILISRIVVDKKYEGKGIAKQLLNEITKNKIEYQSIIRADNKRALKLHKGSGFSIHKPYFYKNGDLGFILIKH